MRMYDILLVKFTNVHLNCNTTKMRIIQITISFQQTRCYSDDDLICDPSAQNQSHVGRVRFPLRAEMHGSGQITDSCFIAFITSKIC